MPRGKLCRGLGLLACVGCLVAGNPAWGQKSEPRGGSSISVVTGTGAHLYAPGKWGIFDVILSNSHDDTRELLVTTYFVDEPTLQYGRRVWVPPRSQMRTWYPILIPTEVSEGARRTGTRTLVTDAGQKSEVLIRSDSGHLQHDGSLQVAKAGPVTGIIDIPKDATEEDELGPVELLIAVQSAELLIRQNTMLADDNFAPGEESLHALDQLVMVDGRVAGDEAGLEAIRRWLFGGGHLWVMLDRVDSRVLELILGDDIACEVIDRVGLTSVRIESAEQDQSRRSNQPHDRPVDFVRVAVTDADIAYTVDGWPAAFWKPCGEGWLLVTTLGARGWTRSRTEADDAPAVPVAGPPGPAGALQIGGGAQPPPPAANTDNAAGKGKFVVLPSMKGLAAKFFGPRPAPLLPSAVLEPQLAEYVGYSIPPRWQIVTLLSGVSLGVAGLGSFLWRRARPERLGWVGPGLAVAVSAVLVLLGRHYRHAVPATVASIQFVQAPPGSDDVRVQGVAGLFSPEGGTATIAGDRGGWLMPEMTGLEGSARRMVWTDMDKWRWENLRELAGLRSAKFLAPAATTERLEASATFGPAGIEGRLHLGPRRVATDAMLATRDGRIAVHVRNDGGFSAANEDVFAPGQFLEGALWTDEQNRRARILQMLLKNPLRQEFPAAPQLLFWTDPWDLGFQFDDGQNLLGAALVALPLHWERPPPGTQVTIPAPLLPYRATAGPDGLVPGLWDYRKRRWQEKSLPSATWLRFQVPPMLLPVEVERARVSLEVSGPVGKLEIAGLGQKDGGQKGAVPLRSPWIDPWGKLSLEITQADLLPISADGGLLLRVSAGDPERPQLTQPDPADSSKTVTWKIESLSLELVVKTATAPAAGADPAGEK